MQSKINKHMQISVEGRESKSVLLTQNGRDSSGKAKSIENLSVSDPFWYLFFPDVQYKFLLSPSFSTRSRFMNVVTAPSHE